MLTLLHILTMLYTIATSVYLAFALADLLRPVPALPHAYAVSSVFAHHLEDCGGVPRNASLSRARLWAEFTDDFCAGAIPIRALSQPECVWNLPFHRARVRTAAQLMRADLAALTLAIAAHIVQLGALQARWYGVLVLRAPDLEILAASAHVIANVGLVAAFGYAAVVRGDVGGGGGEAWAVAGVAAGVLVLELLVLARAGSVLLRAVGAAGVAAVSLAVQSAAVALVGFLALVPWTERRDCWEDVAAPAWLMRVRGKTARKTVWYVPVAATEEQTQWWHTTLAVAQQVVGPGMVVCRDAALEEAWRAQGQPVRWASAGEWPRGSVVVAGRGVLVAGVV
tara:strand:- start:289 stop:1305 length:1017 start_codon:yes stop_codon:yes gene_type:complete